jgi:hypothetical protein
MMLKITLSISGTARIMKCGWFIDLPLHKFSFFKYFYLSSPFDQGRRNNNAFYVCALAKHHFVLESSSIVIH